MEEKAIVCCTDTSCESILNKNYWNSRYQMGETGWNIGKPSPPLTRIIDVCEDKKMRILIPGCGNAHEADYLLQKGFERITLIDIAPLLVDELKTKYADNQHIEVILGDFFQHEGEYDLILEQTFFCAIEPNLREKYVWKMHQLLATNGKIAGLLFDKEFEQSPPFGGNADGYKKLFGQAFEITRLVACDHSIISRQNTELTVEFVKNTLNYVALYTFEGITCSGCQNTIIEKIAALPAVKNASISSDFDFLLVVSEKESVAIEQLQALVSYEAKYKINLFV